MLNSHDAHENREPSRPEPMARDAADRGRADRPMHDREVPLPGTSGESHRMAALHQWLDGECSAADAALEPAQVAFWSRLAVETHRRQQITAPEGLLDNVMAAILQEATTPQPLVGASSHVVPTAGVPLSLALVLGTALLVVGILIGRLIA